MIYLLIIISIYEIQLYTDKVEIITAIKTKSHLADE